MFYLYKSQPMFSVIHLEQKVLTRNAFNLAIEQQSDCKVIYSSGDIQLFLNFIHERPIYPDLCIISDAYHYAQLTTIIKAIKSKSKHAYVLLKSDAKFMKGICYLLKNGLDGVFFTDEPIIDLKNCVLNKTRFKMSADKLKLITTNKMSEFEIKALQYNQTPLTQNEIEFIQACAKDQSYEQVAKELQKSVSTIYGYRDRIFKKLQVKQRTAMVMTALKRNYIDL